MYLRPYQASDFERVYQMDQVCFAPRFRFSRATMRHVVEAKGASVLLACERSAQTIEQVLGFCVVELQQQGARLIGYVATLDVAPELRRRGTGRLLMSAMEQQVVDKGGRWMLLHVFTGNQPAVRLYQRLGYLQSHRVIDFYGAGYDAWIYRKRLVADAPSGSKAAL